MELIKLLLTRQYEAVRLVSRIVPNMKKMGKGKITAAILQRRIAQVQEYLVEIKRIHGDLVATATEDVRKTCEYFKDEVFDACMALCDEDLDYLDEFLMSLSPSKPSINTSSATIQTAMTKITTPLPQISIPKFGGLFTDNEWRSFRDYFSSLIVDNLQLSNLQRMHLCDALSGLARMTISHFQITEENSESAWKLLQDQFENPLRFIFAHLETLFALPAMTAKYAMSIHKSIAKNYMLISSRSND